jgi:hypothetical protein
MLLLRNVHTEVRVGCTQTNKQKKKKKKKKKNGKKRKKINFLSQTTSSGFTWSSYAIHANHKIRNDGVPELEASSTAQQNNGNDAPRQDNAPC